MTLAMASLGDIYKMRGLQNEARETWLDGFLYGPEYTGNVATELFMAELQTVVRKHGCKDLLSKFAAAMQGDEPVSVLAKMRELEAQPDPLRKGSRVELQVLDSAAGRGIEGCTGSVLGKDKSSDRIVVQLDGAERRVVKVKRSNLMITDLLPLSSTLFPEGVACSPYVAGPRDYDIEAGIEQSCRQVAKEATEANALVMESLRSSAQTASIAQNSQSSVHIVIMEYSRPSECFDEALRELGSRKHFAGANCILEPELFEIVVEDFRSREEELYDLGVNLKQLQNRFVITEAHRQHSVEQKIEAAKSAVKAAGTNRKKRGNCKPKRQVSVDVYVPSSSPSSSSHQQGPHAGCGGSLQSGNIGSSSPSSSSRQQGPRLGCNGRSESWVKRTFIQVPVPSAMRSMSSARPQTF